MKSSFEEENLGALVDTKWDRSQQCALVAKANDVLLGCIRRNVASRWRVVILMLYSALEKPQGPVVDYSS